MKILFVSSGNILNDISPLIKAQGQSLEDLGCNVEYYLINGKGLKGYLKQIPVLKKHLLKNNYDLVHAHFSYSGFVAALAGAKPLVVSLMGSDVNAGFLHRQMCYPFIYWRWNKVIVKSEQMKSKLDIESAYVIPNGVNCDIFRPYTREKSIEKLNWDSNQIHLLFAANPKRAEKNYSLAKNLVDKLQNEIQNKINLHSLVGVSHELVPYYMNASDVVLLTSLWEGSPNVIKEAMGCNRPIVSTDVGDVSWLLNDVDGSHVIENDIDYAVEKLNKAIEFSNEHWVTNGRKKILELGIDSKTTANKILNLYENII